MAGCNWCPTICDGEGKCMVGESSPTHEPCPPAIGKESIVDKALAAAGYTIGYGDCGEGSLTASSILAPLIIPFAVWGLVMLLFAVLVAWARRRHGGVRRYTTKKLADFLRFTARLKAEIFKSQSGHRDFLGSL